MTKYGIEYYLEPRSPEGTIYHVWERGQPFGDSITPAVHCPAYREWITRKLLACDRATGGAGILSVGCGNGFVEAELVRLGCEVVGIDIMAEAVRLTREKGVACEVADVTTYEPARTFGVVYADGCLGHLYDPELGSCVGLSHMVDLVEAGGFVLISNDPAPSGRVQEAPGVPGFHWLSERFVVESLVANGADVVDVERFGYERPLSGRRERLVVTATRR